jgi:lipoprotein LpqH
MGYLVFVAACMAGCGVDDTSGASVVTAPAGSVGEAQASIMIDGKADDVQGTVVCTTIGGNSIVAIGETTTGIVAVLTDADPPEVKSVWLGNVNGMTLGYKHGASQSAAEATKDGDTYTIIGTATGVDTVSQQSVNKSFELEATCA